MVSPRGAWMRRNSPSVSRRPAGTPVSPEEQKAKEKADDEDSDALIKKMQQESIEMLKRMQQQQKQQ